MCHFAVDMDCGRLFIRSTVRLGHVEKWPFLMAWRRILRLGIKNAAWYHCASSGLVLSDRPLSAAGHGWIDGWSGLLGRLTCHMPDMFDRVNSNTVRPYFTTLMWVALKVDVHMSSQSYYTKMRTPIWRWGKMCDVVAVGVRRGFRFRTSLWVTCMRPLLISITWGPFLISCLLIHEVLTII